MRAAPLLSTLLLTILAGGGARGESAPSGPTVKVSLLTMGPADGLFTRFGHAAFLVRRPGRPAVVYNFGYTNFEDADLVFDFLRSKARFWAAREGYAVTLRDYRMDDRDLFEQRLRLDPVQARRIARMLARQARSKKDSIYLYHHFEDNCSTRLRDMLDRVSGGRLSRAMKGKQVTTDTYRDLVRRGFAGDLLLLMALDLVVGREVDRPVDLWGAAFLPRYLRLAVQEAGLASETSRLTRRQGPPLSGLDHQAGARALWGLSAAVLLLSLALVLLARSGRRWAGLPLSLMALFFGLASLLVWCMAAYAVLPEFRYNELALVLWPTDLLLLWPALRWLRGRLFAGRLLRGYVAARLAVTGIAWAGHLVGVLRQPPAWSVMVSLFVMGTWLASRQLPRRAPRAEPQLDQSGVEPPPL